MRRVLGNTNLEGIGRERGTRKQVQIEVAKEVE